MSKGGRDYEVLSKKIDGLSKGQFWNFTKAYKELQIKRDELRYLIDNDDDEGFPLLWGLKSKFTAITGRDFMGALFCQYPEELERLFNRPEGDAADITGLQLVKLYLAQEGFVPSFDTYDALADSSCPDIYLWALKVCSLEKLKEHKNNSDKSARKIVFERLGPKECLKEMLSDRSKNLRAMGVDYAPIQSEELLDLYEEENLQICTKILKKASIDIVPLILGNKNSDSATFKSLLKFRIEDCN